MLASITPLGERGRRSTWAITVSAFALASVLCAAAFGAALGALGGALELGIGGRRWIFAGLALGALALELSPGRLPGPRRQVNERWLDDYRGWVYGTGFGGQLGLGILTVVSSAATYLALCGALLSASAPGGAVVLGVHGLVRGFTPLAAAGVSSPQRLVALHRAIESWRAPVGRLATGSLALLSVAALALAASL